MPKAQRHSVVGYAGVFFIESPSLTRRGIEKIYYIRYRKNNKLIEEKVGGQYRDNMTPAKASNIRGNRIEGKELNNHDKRNASQKEKEAEKNRYTFERLWNLFAEDRRNIRTLDDDISRYNLHVASHIAHKTATEISTHDIDKIRKILEKKKKSPQTIKHVLTLIKRILNFALQRGYIEPFEGRLHIIMPLVDNKVTENLTEAQIMKLLDVLETQSDQNLASLVRLALYTGMRRTALLNLKWTDLDFENGFITLRGDTAKKGKTEIIPMNTLARNVLEEIDHTTSEYIFPNTTTGKPRANITGFLKKIREEAGLPEGFRPLHGLRHAFASWLASSGEVSMYELQKLLTHSSPQMTQRYAHLHDDALKKASDVTANLFAKAKTI